MELPLEFYAFLALWSLVWIVTKVRSSEDDKNHFASNISLLTVNQIVGITMGALSLYFNDETMMKESTMLSWYCSFFVVDLLDCIYRRDMIYSIHAVLALVLGRANFIPKYYHLRTGSKGAMIELSTLFYYRWKATKKKVDFQIFSVVFFFCRLVWIPVFTTRAAQEIDMDGFVIYASVALYILQLGFFGKIIKVLSNYKEKSKEA